MRVALKVAYDGTRFHGSQAQPGLRTVHREVLDAFASLGNHHPRLAWAGRTDAGVSARGNVVVADTDAPPAKLLPSLTFAMEDAWAWAWAEVDESFEPRHSSARHYRYHLRAGLDAKRLQDAMAPFVGTHDFTAFSRLEPGINPRRSVSAIEVRREGSHLLVDVHGQNFLRNQVRRMVEAGRRVAEGDLAQDEVRRLLASGEDADLGIAPPEPLVLMDVEYPGVRFTPADEALARRLFERLRRRRAERELELARMDALLGGVG